MYNLLKMTLLEKDICKLKTFEFLAVTAAQEVHLSLQLFVCNLLLFLDLIMLSYDVTMLSELRC